MPQSILVPKDEFVKSEPVMVVSFFFPVNGLRISCEPIPVNDT